MIFHFASSAFRTSYIAKDICGNKQVEKTQQNNEGNPRDCKFCLGGCIEDIEYQLLSHMNWVVTDALVSSNERQITSLRD
jgi:hypothetical protein